MRSKFEGANKIYPNSVFDGAMGYGSYVSSNCEIFASIGRFTSIAPYVRTNSAVHPYSAPYVSTSPMFFSLKKQNGRTFANVNKYCEFKTAPVIGNDCWICENVFICGGVTIGDGAVVMAGSIVTKDIPPYAVVSGMPATIKRYRYDNETIQFLLSLKWWNNDLVWFEENWELLCDIEKLKSKYLK